MFVLTPRRTIAAVVASVLAVGLLVGIVWALVAGGDDEPPIATPASTLTPGVSDSPGPSGSPGTPGTAGTPGTPGGEPSQPVTTVLQVYVHRESNDDPSHVEPLTRTVPPTTMPATAALFQLLAGPTAAERSAGYTSFFSSATTGKLRRVTIHDGVAYADFQNFSEIVPNASSSFGATALLAELDATLRQFPTVRSTVYSFDDDVVAFYSWLRLDAPHVSGTTPAAAVSTAREFLSEVAGLTDPARLAFRTVTSDEAAVAVYQRGEAGDEASTPATTVSLRRGPSAWTVTGARADSIVVAAPASGTAIASPLPVGGRASAFEGTVVVRVVQVVQVVQVSGPAATEVGQGIVTGGGTDLQPFSGAVAFTPPTADQGWVVFAEHSALDGAVWRLTAVPVTFG